MRSAVLFLLLAGLPLAASAELTDPTRPSHARPDAGEPAPVAVSLNVTAVFVSGDRRIAIVNGQRVRVGETVDGVTVSRIERNRVSFSRGDRVFTVPLLSAGRR